MVQMSSTFDNPTCAENGLRREAFKAWKVGNGRLWGGASRDWLNDPSMSRAGRSSPAGIKMYRPNPFWKTKIDDSAIPFTFGYGERKDFADRAPYKLDPATYGDVNPLVSLVKRDPRKNISLKGRFARPGQGGYNPSNSTPGPKYDVSRKSGDMVRNVYFNARPRSLDPNKVPGPGAYETRSKPGRNYPITFTTLYQVTLKGREKPPVSMAWKNPGPGAYRVPGFTDKYDVAPIGFSGAGNHSSPKKAKSTGDLGSTVELVDMSGNEQTVGEGTLLMEQMRGEAQSTFNLAEAVDAELAGDLPGVVSEM
jgi:hypothetical protein